MRVLIACEYSGTVREAFRALGHDAWSCDLLPADDDSPHHLQVDVGELLEEGRWDMIVMHPPCTALCVSGNRWYGKGKPKHSTRLEAIEWTMSLWERANEVCPRVCMENPVGVLPMKASQWVQPWQFGDSASKKTGLWLSGLPELKPSNVVSKGERHVTKSGRSLPKWYNLPPSEDRWKVRSKTFQGIADAMAAQWGGTL